MKIFLLQVLFVHALFAGLYDNHYTIQTEANQTQGVDSYLMTERFKEIIRFDMLSYDNKMLIDVDEKNIKDIAQIILNHQNNGEEIAISIIGHTDRPTDDINEKTIDSDTYANKIQNNFRYSLSTQEAEELSQSYALDIQDRLVEEGVNKNSTIIEYRAGLDKAFTDTFEEGRKLSNRVMVTLYVLMPKDIDSDEDGVFDRLDMCQNTQKGLEVDSQGCPYDTDQDGIFDHKDKCPNTLLKVKVDDEGCPLDSDQDGVADYKDDCSNTPLGVKVDSKGCPVEKVLALNFKTNSDKIFKSSYPKIVEFAAFLKAYPMYKAEIIGHTDSVGKQGSNMKLSENRALSVRAALIEQGIEASRLTSAGRGELDPIADNHTKEGRSQNRRIEVKLSY